MARRTSHTSLPDQGASRRQFFKFLAASPLLGLAYSSFPSSWQEAIAREVPRRGTAGVRCADCGAELVLPSSAHAAPHAVQDPVMPPQNALEDQLTGQIVESPDDAVNVWDFERVAHANNLGLSGFPNAETLNLTMSYVDVGLIGHRVQTRKGPV